MSGPELTGGGPTSKPSKSKRSPRKVIGGDVACTEDELEPAAVQHVNCGLVFITTGLCRSFGSMSVPTRCPGNVSATKVSTLP
jgi:hypothetical protein